MSSPNSSHSQLDLAPSGSGRWTVCRASPGFIQAHAAEIPEETSVWADEGTLAHEVGAAILTNAALPEDANAEQLQVATDYAKFVRERVEGGTLIVEQKVPLFYMPERTGRIDSAIINAKGIAITDLKYGAGVSVEAQGNTQLAIYGLSFILWLRSEGLTDVLPVSTPVVLAIYQPRARDKRTVRLWALTLGELNVFCGTIAGIADLIQKDPEHQEFSPSDKTCQFCPAQSICKARTASLFSELPAVVQAPLEAVLSFPTIGSLTPEQLGRIVRAQGPIEHFLEDVRDHAYALASQGTPVPGCKLVAGKSNRAWSDEARAEDLLRQKMSIDVCMPRKLVSVAQAEKLLKGTELSTKYANLIKSVIVKPEGKPTLVSEDDPRDALDLNPVKELTAIEDSLQ